MSIPSLRTTSFALRGASRPMVASAAMRSITRRANSSIALEGQQQVRSSPPTAAFPDRQLSDTFTNIKNHQLLSAHLSKADPAVFDIIEKVCSLRKLAFLGSLALTLRARRKTARSTSLTSFLPRTSPPRLFSMLSAVSCRVCIVPLQPMQVPALT